MGLEDAIVQAEEARARADSWEAAEADAQAAGLAAYLVRERGLAMEFVAAMRRRGVQPERLLLADKGAWYGREQRREGWAIERYDIGPDQLGNPQTGAPVDVLTDGSLRVGRFVLCAERVEDWNRSRTDASARCILRTRCFTTDLDKLLGKLNECMVWRVVNARPFPGRSPEGAVASGLKYTIR